MTARWGAVFYLYSSKSALPQLSLFFYPTQPHRPNQSRGNQSFILPPRQPIVDDGIAFQRSHVIEQRRRDFNFKLIAAVDKFILYRKLLSPPPANAERIAVEFHFGDVMDIALQAPTIEFGWQTNPAAKESEKPQALHLCKSSSEYKFERFRKDQYYYTIF